MSPEVHDNWMTLNSSIFYKMLKKKESSREKPPEDVLDMKDFLVYRSLDWRKHFKSPLPNGFCVKMGHIQNFGQVINGVLDTNYVEML